MPQMHIGSSRYTHVPVAVRCLAPLMQWPNKELSGEIDRTSSLFRSLLYVVVLVFTLLQTLPGLAQDSPATLQLTLKEAVALALRQNIDLQVANLTSAAIQQDSHVARAALLPQAAFQASEEIQRYNLEAMIGLNFVGIPKDVGPFQSFRAGPRFSVPIFDLGLIRSYQASGYLFRASRDDVNSTREQTVLLTASQYLACLRAEAQVKAAESRVQLAISLANQAEALEGDGVATKIDVSRATVSLISQKQRLIDAQSDVQTTTLALKRILNVPDGLAINLVDTDLFTQTPELNVPNAVTSALKERPELQSLSESVKAASAKRKAALARSLPTITASGGWNEQGRTFGSVYPGYDYEAAVNVPLFTGGRLAAERKIAALDEQRITHQLQDARNRVTEQVRAGEVELKAARTDVNLGRQQVQLAREEVDLAQSRFSVGVTDNIEVTTAQDELARASDTEIAAFYRYNLARANLARAIGSIEKIYTQF